MNFIYFVIYQILSLSSFIFFIFKKTKQPIMTKLFVISSCVYSDSSRVYTELNLEYETQSMRVY